MENLITYTNYQQFKQELDTEMYKAAEGFVKIGYLLNVAATTDILLESGYVNVNEFARAEYGIDATQVSRFINIHKRFGVPGEARLQDRYQSHGVAKLGIMLTLPDYINEEISGEYSKSEISAIKKEIEEEQKITDIEVLMEEKDPVQQSLPEGLKQSVHQLVHEYPQEYVRMYNAITLEDLKEALAPNGECSYTFRVPGTGKLILFAKENGDIGIVNVRSGEKENYEWQQLHDALKEYFSMGTDGKTSWSNVFNEPFPESEKPQNNNVQQAIKEEIKKEPKKESKVKTPAPKPKQKLNQVEEAKEPEEQLPGQDSIMNHPEYLPTDMQEEPVEVLTGEVEDVVPEDANVDKYNVEQDCEQIAPVQENKTITGYKAAISGAISRMRTLFDNGEWDKLIIEADKVSWRAQQIKKMGEK